MSTDSQYSEYSQQIVGYIAGFVVRSLRKQVKCVECLTCVECLISTEKFQYHKLVNMRDEGRLIYASHDVYILSVRLLKMSFRSS